MNKLFYFLLASFLFPECYALRLQILHTNDLHSFFEGTRDGQGGYARLKSLADRLRVKAKTDGMKTLFLDGGDFGEGTSYFLADKGATSLSLLDALGVDATVVGNHDYLMGTDTLSDQMDRAGLKAHMLSANIDEKTKKLLGNRIKDLVNFEIDGVRIGVFGLTTVDLHYKYALKDSASFTDPDKQIAPMEKLAGENQVDFLIGLTHLGVEKDESVVKKSSSVDLIVGGHSHTRLEEALYRKNKNGRSVPIVQAGSHSLAIGELIIEINPKTKAHKILSYRLHNVTPDLPQDETIHQIVKNAHISREQAFGRSFDEIIGESSFDLSGYENGNNPESISCWGGHLARMTKHAAGADLGLHLAAFEGEKIPRGFIRYGDLVDNYPHFRKFGDPGWEIVTVQMKGMVLEKIYQFISTRKGQLGWNFSGIERSGKDTLVNGEKIKSWKSYGLALPHEVTFALETALPFIKRFIYQERKQTGVFIWNGIEEYLRLNSPLSCTGAS
ncbi:MAG TPA: metallophosphatase [Bacteriovoracaceae bacterium]|nr:metallophosphatase [Bacteriovoracaceae bacterium]